MARDYADWISIHAPREGSDRHQARRAEGGEDFYPRSPRGERRYEPNTEAWEA